MEVSSLSRDTNITKQKQGIGLNHLQLNLNAFELKIKINYINLHL